MSTPLKVYSPKREIRFAYQLILPTLIVILSLLGYPLIYAFIQSFQQVTVFQPVGFFIGLDNYIRAINEPIFLSSLIRSFVFVGFSITGSLVVGLAIALLLNRDIPGQKAFRALIMLPFVISEVSVGVIWQWLLSPQLGVINHMLQAIGLSSVRWLSDPFYAMISVIMANIWRLTPFPVLILIAGLSSIDTSMYEAADIDGASAADKLWHITLPMLRPMLTVCLVYLSFASFNQFATIFSLTGGGPGEATEVLALYMYTTAFQNFNWGYGSAIAILLFIINVVLSATYSKVLEQGDD